MAIKIAIGAPLAMMNDLCPMGHIELCFTHLMNNDNVNYKRYYLDAKANNRFVILDNGIMELGYSMDINTLIQVSKELEPELVTPPEVLNDSYATLKMTLEFVKHYERHKLFDKTKILGVAHGSTFKEWRDSFVELTQIPYITRIAIPYDIPFDINTTPKKNTNRLKNLVLRRVDLCNWIANNHENISIHLFGLAHPSELNFQSHHSFIESIDTSLPVMAALKKIRYDVSDFGPYEKEILDINAQYSANTIELAKHNISILKQNWL